MNKYTYLIVVIHTIPTYQGYSYMNDITEAYLDEDKAIERINRLRNNKFTNPELYKNVVDFQLWKIPLKTK